MMAGCGGSTIAPPSQAPATQPSPALPGLPRAADGDNLSACQAGTCEVQVTGRVEIPIDPRFQLRNLRIDSIGPDGVTWVATLSPAVTSASNHGYCGMEMDSGSATEAPTLRATCHAGAEVDLPSIALGTVAVGDGGAVIRLEPR